MKNGTPNNIGLSELLEDISNRLQELRQRQPGFHNTVLWWETEKDRLRTKYSIVNCVVTNSKPRRQWRKRFTVPGRWFDLSLICLCLALGCLALLS